MKIVYAILTAALATTGVAAAKDMSPAEKQITAMEAAISKAFVDRDTKVLEASMAEDWTGQSDAPKMMTKADLIQGVKTGEMTASSMVNRALIIRMIGNIAIVQGGDTEKSAYKGKDTSGVYSWTDIVENRGGKWVSIATQITKLK